MMPVPVSEDSAYNILPSLVFVPYPSPFSRFTALARNVFVRSYTAACFCVLARNKHVGTAWVRYPVTGVVAWMAHFCAWRCAFARR